MQFISKVTVVNGCDTISMRLLLDGMEIFTYKSWDGKLVWDKHIRNDLSSFIYAGIPSTSTLILPADKETNPFKEEKTPQPWIYKDKPVMDGIS